MFLVWSVPAALSLFALAARWWRPAELCTHFRAHFFLALAAAAIYYALARSWKLGSMFAAFAVFNASFVAPLYLPALDRVARGSPIRVMSVNANCHNKCYDRLLQVVNEMAPDALLVIEVNDAWLKAMGQLAETYPYHIARPRRDGWGIALFSRVPVAQLEIREIGPAGVPSVFSRIGGPNGRLLYLLGTHPPAPVKGSNFPRRNAQLDELAQLASTLDGPVVLIGDVNTTSWSPYFRDLLEVSRLRDSRQGFGIQSTWPSRLGRFGIAIDHALVSPEINVRKRTVGPDVGSDHRPIVIDLEVQALR